MPFQAVLIRQYHIMQNNLDNGNRFSRLFFYTFAPALILYELYIQRQLYFSLLTFLHLQLYNSNQSWGIAKVATDILCLQQAC
jgi:hypothetical protein